MDEWSTFIDLKWTMVLMLWFLSFCAFAFVKKKHPDSPALNAYIAWLYVGLAFLIVWPFASPTFCDNVKCRGKLGTASVQ